MSIFQFIDPLLENNETLKKSWKIYDLEKEDESVPSEYNAVKLKIDGSLRATLDWKAIRKQAIRYVGQGLYLFWEIDLGINSRLEKPLSDEKQFLSLSLSLDHFVQTLWEELHLYTIGVSLYRGSSQCADHFFWGNQELANLQGWGKEFFHKDVDLTPEKICAQEQGKEILGLFCLQAVVDYLNLLLERLPDQLPVYILLEVQEGIDPFWLVQFLAKDRYGHVHRAISLRNHQLPIASILSAESVKICSYLSCTPLQQMEALPALGLCIPSNFFDPESIICYQNIIQDLRMKKTPFRIILETDLNAEWCGLDVLMVDEEKISAQGRRKLRGFSAAGGEILQLGSVPHFIP